MALSATIEKIGGWLSVRLGGAIDEESDLAGLFDRLDADVVFDLAGVNRINSIGVLRWTPLIAKLAEKWLVVIESASYPLVLQANSVANFFGGAKVRSCLAPYRCPACQESQMVLVTAEEVAAGEPPAKRCACGGPLEFDELDSYFSFLTSQS